MIDFKALDKGKRREPMDRAMVDRTGLVERRKAAFTRFNQALGDFERAIRSGKVVEAVQDGATRFPQWDRTQAAYEGLRLLYVAPRNRSGWRRGPKGKPVPEPLSLDAWKNQSTAFRDTFYGPADKNGKRHFDGVDGEIALVMRRYRALWSKWHKKTPEYKAQQRTYMKAYMTKRRAAAKAAKEAAHVQPV